MLTIYLIISIILIATVFFRPLWVLGFLAAYFPFEPFLLKFVPDESYLYIRFFPEVLIYVLAFTVFWRFLQGRNKARKSTVDLPVIVFALILIFSALINAVEPNIAILGIRQILRFVLLFFVVHHLFPKQEFIRKFTLMMFGIAIFQSLLGISQSIIGAPLDEFLIPDERRTGIQQFWDSGSRVFSTLGRYDILGNFLYIFLLIGVAIAYEKKLRNRYNKYLLPLFVLGIPALVMTFSRSSWFAFLLGFLFIAVLIKKDKLVAVAFLSLILAASLFLGLSGLQVRYITEVPGQTLVERFYETFSYTRWKGEYVGLGRMFWMVHTPVTVIPASPIFGFGPGQYGGGAASTLRNTKVYEEVGLPFGVYGTEGMIDNNWFSLWGESGTLGMVFYLWAYIALFVYSLKLYGRSNDPFVRSIALGFAAIQIAIAFNAFTSTLLEIRPVAFYLWTYAGFVVVLGSRGESRFPLLFKEGLGKVPP